MTFDRTDKDRIKILKQVNRRLVSDLKEIRDLAKKSLAYCEKQGYRKGRAMEQVQQIVDGSLLYLDCRQVDLMVMDLEMPKDQMKLQGVSQ